MNRNNSDYLISTDLEQACAREPIHLLGTVQPHGVMMTVDAVTGHIVQVSSGIARHWPGLPAAALMIGTPLKEWVDGIDADFAHAASTLPAAYPLAVPWRPRLEHDDVLAFEAAGMSWECLGHRSGAHVVLEWQPVRQDDVRQQSRIFSDITQAIARLRSADRLETFFDDCAHVVQGFSHFDRVMIYRFMTDGCGEVVAEHTAPTCPIRFLGLRFPASDIPAQARALYLSNRLRMLADVEARTDTLLPPTLPDGSLLDQSHCMLRGLSPVHLSYLHNMGVRATLTLSIVCGGRLWGLIACHHHQPTVPPHHVRDGLRQVCELVAEVTNMRIEALQQLEAVRLRMTHDHLQNRFQHTLIAGGAVEAVLEALLPEVLDVFGATGFGVRIDHIDYFAGHCQGSAAPQQVLDEIATRLDYGSSAPAERMWDDLLTAPERSLSTLPAAAGLLLGQRHEEGAAFCFLIRPEAVQQVRWAGEPVKAPASPPDGMIRLEPRRSFAEWQQAVRGRSTAWDQASADGLRMLLQILTEAHKLRVNRALHEKLHWRAMHDQLTGLYNRRAMEDEVSRRLGEDEFDVALLLIDLDNFKQINDTYGHAAGDQVLKQLAQRLGSEVREFDLLARQGGDEFMLLLHIPHPDPMRALLLAERLQQVVAAPVDFNGQQMRLGMSIGIAIPPGHGRTVGELLRRADLALYHAKSLGRARSVVFERRMEFGKLDLYLLERDLNDAVTGNQLGLVFQPKVDLASRRVVGLEALVRWHHPTRGENMPAIFIPIAERSDQIVQIDRWVMRAALATQSRWEVEGRAPLPVAINLSMADILSPDLVAYIADLMTQYAVPPAALEVEVTESCMMRELDHTRGVLAALNRNGIQTTLDDFGTGFSSLSHLRHLPLQCLKIDQSFTSSMLQDSNVEKLTQAILAMGHALGMHVIAEGVETREQMDWLVAHGCHIGQGYFFSRPVLAQEVHRTIDSIESRLLDQT